LTINDAVLLKVIQMVNNSYQYLMTIVFQQFCMQIMKP